MAFPSVSRGNALKGQMVPRSSFTPKWLATSKPNERYPSPKRCPQLPTTKGTRYDPSPRNYRHRTRHGISACYGDGELVTTHPATDSEHHIAGGI